MTSDYNKIAESSRQLLDVVLKSGLEVKAPDGSTLTTDNLKNFLSKYSEENIKDLIDFTNNIVEEISNMTETRAEAILNEGHCDIIDNCERLSGANYDKQAISVINKIYEMCTSGEYTWSLPNGNTFTPQNIQDKTKMMIKCYLNDESEKFKIKYLDSPELFEKNLENYLYNDLMNCGLQVLSEEINDWKNIIKDFTFLSNDSEFNTLKKCAEKLLSKAIYGNIIIVIDDKKITSAADIESLMNEYSKNDYEDLINLINTFTETIQQWKTVLQKLIDNDYAKNEVTITTFSFDDIDCTKMFTDSKILQCYYDNEIYEEHFINDTESRKRIEKIIDETDKLKATFMRVSKAQCRVHKVKFNENEFEGIFNNVKTSMKKEGFKIERGWMPGITIKFRPDEFCKIFIKNYKKACASLISRKINDSN